MIPADKGGVRGWLWSRYIDGRLGRAFRGVWLDGAVPKTDRAMLFYSNHVSWWDGFAFFRLTRAHGIDGYCVMEEQNLKRYRFLSRLGAFSIRRGDSRSALETIRYAGRLLGSGKRAMVIFPTGVLDPTPLQRPLERGVEVLARVTGARCVPMALRYAFFEDPKPDLVISIGEAHDAAPLERFAAGMAEAMARATAVTDPTRLTRLRTGFHEAA